MLKGNLLANCSCKQIGGHLPKRVLVCSSYWFYTANIDLFMPKDFLEFNEKPTYENKRGAFQGSM